MSGDIPFALLPLETQAARLVVALNGDGLLQVRSQQLLHDALILALAEYEPNPGGFDEGSDFTDCSREAYLFLALFKAAGDWMALLEPDCQLNTLSAIQTVLREPVAVGAFNRLYTATRESEHFTAARSLLLKVQEDGAAHRSVFEQAGAEVWPIEGASTA